MLSIIKYLNSRKIFIHAIVFTCLVHVVYLISIPIFISPDGLDYIRMQNLFFTDHFQTHWNFVRTPFFPFLLKAVGYIFGLNSSSVAALLTILGLMTVISLAYLFRVKLGNLQATIVILLLTFNPILIAYEHSLLMETLLCLSFAVFLVLVNIKIKNLYLHACILGIYIGLLYYVKPNLFTLAGPAILLLGVRIWKQRFGSKSRIVLSVFLNSLIIVTISLLMSIPWANFVKKGYNDHEATKRGFMMGGLLVQGVLLPDSYVLGNKKNEYEQALKQFTHDGKVEVQGIIGHPEFYAIMSQLFRESPNPFLEFLELASLNPKAYLRGLINNVKIMLEFDHPFNETINFALMLFRSDRNLISESNDSEEFQSYVKDRFSVGIGGSIVQKFMVHTIPIYQLILKISWCVTFFLFFVGIRKLDVFLISVSLLPIFWSSVNLFALVSSARYFFPTNLIVILNFVIFVTLMVRKWNEKTG